MRFTPGSHGPPRRQRQSHGVAARINRELARKHGEAPSSRAERARDTAQLARRLLCRLERALRRAQAVASSRGASATGRQHETTKGADMKSYIFLPVSLAVGGLVAGCTSAVPRRTTSGPRPRPTSARAGRRRARRARREAAPAARPRGSAEGQGAHRQGQQARRDPDRARARRGAARVDLAKAALAGDEAQQAQDRLQKARAQ